MRNAAQIYAAVAVGQRLVIHHQLKIAVVLVTREIQSLAIVDEFAVRHTPVRVDVFRSGLAQWKSAFDGLPFVVGQLSGRHRPQLGGVLGAPAIPAGEIFPVEECREAFRRSIVSRARERGEGEQAEKCANEGVLHKGEENWFGGGETDAGRVVWIISAWRSVHFHVTGAEPSSEEIELNVWMVCEE